MGALQSLPDAPIDGFPAKTLRNSGYCCQACGMQFDRSREDPVVNQTLWAHSHYLAELCGIWLGSPDSSQRESAMNKQLDSSSSFVAFPSTTLPKRSVSSSKPSMIVSTLIKHTDFTKNERSALKHGFFSTMDVNTAGLTDCSGLEGCHIRGCLYVEHGSLVFQAVDSSHQLPSVLTSRKEESSDEPNSLTATMARRTRSRGSDPTAPGSNVNDFLRSSLLPYSMYRRTRRKLWTYFHDGRSSPSRHQEGYCNCHGCRKDSKSTETWKSTDVKGPVTDNKTAEQSSTKCTIRRGDSVRGQDMDAVDQDITRLPPPPLRLSWPLCTLRRFGFYGNTLFKLEAGRRAPRGEGHYLFRIRTLREFREYFEHFVHRRKSLSPPKSPPDCSIPTSLLSGLRITDFERPDTEADSIAGPLPVQPYPINRNPVLDSKPRPLVCGLPADSELDLDPCSSVLLTQSQIKQKANSLSQSTLRRSAVSPNCLDWVRQQQEQQHQHQNLCWHQRQTQPFDSEQRSNRLIGFQSSCPHLSSAFTVTSTPKIRSTFCIDSEADDLISLPDPPPPPTSCAQSTGTGLVELPETQKIYDNVQMDCLRSVPITSERRLTDRVEEENSAREWLAPSSLQLPPRGRLYTSRRAMTAFACSNLYPIPSRHHEEEEDDDSEDEDANGDSEQAAQSESSHQVTSPICSTHDPQEPSTPSVPSTVAQYHNEFGDQHPGTQRRPPSNGVHSRHTSLPNPISVDTLFAIARAEGTCSQPNPVQSKNSQETNSSLVPTLPSDQCVDEIQQHSAYYNLSSPEALGQLEQTDNPSRSASIRATFVSTDCGPATDTTVNGTQSSPAGDGIFRTGATYQSGCNVQDDICVVQPLFGPRAQSYTDSHSQEVVCTGLHSMLVPHPDGAEPSVSLHYATLDFSPPTPDRAQSSIDLHTMEPVMCNECTTDHCVHDTGNPLDGRDTVCPMRVYGTFVHDPMGHVGNSGSRVRSLSSSGAPPTLRPSSTSTAENELPANYVAICQLQTLAMRAVLNATT